MAGAAHSILCRDSKTTRGSFFVNEDVLRADGVRDFDLYAVKPVESLMKDLFPD
jgi:citronellol/citronellal dehydrogenase